MSRQLTFSLPARAALGRHDFLVAPPNETALQMIDDWQSWPGRKLLLVGPEGAGKTHLAHVWAAAAEAEILNAQTLPARLEQPLAPGARIAVEDADRMTGEAAQVALFSLHNLLAADGGWLLVTASRPVAAWVHVLPDLKSRLQAAPVAWIDEPDDALLNGVLLKHFDDRQLQIDPNVVAYLATRIERSFAAARAAVDLVDREALAQKREITRPFVAELLEIQGENGDI